MSENIINGAISDTQANREPKKKYDELKLDVNIVKIASIPVASVCPVFYIAWQG